MTQIDTSTAAVLKLAGDHQHVWDNPDKYVMGHPYHLRTADVLRQLVKERDDLRAKLDAAVDALGNIDALDPEGMIDGCSPLAFKGLVLCMGEIARATITKIKGADHE